ncbi:hypothetical protein K443DRAFT_430450 [Laccaria amethystina LaAM-08-1]|uniref:Uncharacterized protein n=1 Tax=Laccaria amethystina LaAM-08-1 TaxID=1095629 RepID=A0A0C9WP44_9AGAR|nr:hypothetical protein K443DRAFT_430450 [Laccaria amethystina LaAM-08-1]
MLLHPYLFRWTQCALKANARTIDSPWCKVSSAISSSPWLHRFPSSLYPRYTPLSSLQVIGLIKGKGVAFQDIESFLKRHSKLRFLALSRITIPNPTPQLRKPIVPKLHTLEAPTNL